MHTRADGVAPAQAASEASFEDFFRDGYTKLFRALFLLVGSVHEADELCQEAFVRVFERWERIRAMGSPEGYLFRTALNLHRSRLRRAARRLRDPVLHARPEDEAARTAEGVDVARALRDIPVGQRAALILVDWLGYDAAEAGRILDIEAVSVRSRLHRARSALRERLGEPDA